MTIGILALQGAFAEHEAMLGRLGVDYFELRQARDLARHMDGLILPGGESTVMRKLLCDLGLFEPLRSRILDGLPVFGTCAGLILLARQVKGGEPCFGTMDITVLRNAYGRQLGSFYTTGDIAGIGQVPMHFIRAPYIESVGSKAQALSVVGGHIVAARQGHQLVTAFHPELTECSAMHEAFCRMVMEA